MQQTLITIQVTLSILLIVLVLIQNKDGGLSAFMGGSGDSFKTTKRGAEKVLHNTTILVSTLFLLNAFIFVLT